MKVQIVIVDMKATRYLKKCALAGVAQWIEHIPENQRVAGSIPSQIICLGCVPGPQ